jgi:hypothetical protein
MRKYLGFALAAAAVWSLTLAWDTAGSVTPDEHVVRAKVEMPALVADPHLPSQVLRPLY